MKKRSFTRIIAIVSVFAALLLVLTGCGNSKKSSSQSNNPSSVQQIKKNGTIRIAVFGDLPPYGWVNKDGKRVGYDVTLAHQVAKDLGVKVKFVQVNANNRVDALNSNKVDLVLANFTVTPERKQVIDFTKPYMKVSVGVVSPKNKAITKASQLKGKNVIVTKGTTAENYFTSKQPDVKLLKFDSKTQQFNALKNGRGVALADDNSYLYAWSKDNPNYTVGIKSIGPKSYIAPAVKKGNKSLLDWTNKEINKLTKESFFVKDYNTQLKPYFGKEVKPSDIVLPVK
ncbi:cysteine ABC transporter substrate-binding protein [Lentilactobacillus buchneri]|uniref:ABC-type amino acid transport/signal transduction system, periplasmic component n=1 Tax=Lentilactobacillus buchneri subsp. silagei CD034 TaxID=1071400 RepID=J9W128_LENBU|nr:cysteine ABC transporter substrate-binding protein [Lentilactobacillus buchneri]MCC6100867.1 cysteine ABC transporter substrate-binding protein [Lactobacillus sp.]AFR99381.1 ABC-type amino acid transport/signal transduction system, periplasmic component [Lentilactobacillus buchneri subsp. silagei CD034]MCT2900810.1 ABC transporter substrate-binding protein [Lentilactobacillus buchneri]MCT3542247.1 ABC transporter substrate-binding protein [Lentilactobacillus buchneri]MCT3546077.1 ABC transp